MAKKKTVKKKKRGFTVQIMVIFCGLAALVFAPTTILLFIGLMPTIVAALIDRTSEKTKALTVGAMNLAGCTPFLLQLWTKDHSIGPALAMVSDPRTIIVMYCSAGIGYVIDWALTGVVSSIIIQRSRFRLDSIAREQAELVERWGQEVTGTLPLDPYGFPLEQVKKTSDPL